jgi:hypothetical protein
MKLSIRPNKKQPFSRRFARNAFFWGIPMVCLEFIGVPRSAWGTVLIFAVPATIVGLFVYTAYEDLFIWCLSKIKPKTADDSGRNAGNAGGPD